MSKENIKICKEELEVKKALYKKILDDNYYFFWALKKRFEKEENQVPKKAFIDMVKTWLSIYEVEFEVKVTPTIKKDGTVIDYMTFLTTDVKRV